MRIIHILKHARRQNGNVHVAVDLACIQVSQGHDVAYVSAGGDFEGILRQHGVQIQAIDLGRQNIFATLKSFFNFVRFCVKFKPDVIHAHMMSGAIFGFFAGLLTRTPMITTVHNSFDSHSWLMKLGKKVVAVSEAERQALIGRGFREDKVVTVLNGTTGSPRDFFGRSSELKLPEKSILAVCGLTRRKGVHDMIEAVRLLGAAFDGWHLYIAGGGPDREELGGQVEQSHLTHCVKFLESVDRPKDILRQAAIFVLASYAEPCALVLSEARASGCAMIGTRVGGTPENLDGGKTGLLVEPGNPEQLAAAIGQMISDPSELAAWRNRAQQGVEKFDLTRVARDYQTVYESVLSKRMARVPANAI